MNKYYCYVEIEGERKFFGDYELRRANEAAQAEANRTGQPVKRQDYSGPSYSLFYPERKPARKKRTA